MMTGVLLIGHYLIHTPVLLIIVDFLVYQDNIRYLIHQILYRELF